MWKCGKYLLQSCGNVINDCMLACSQLQMLQQQQYWDHRSPRIISSFEVNQDWAEDLLEGHMPVCDPNQHMRTLVSRLLICY